MIITAIVLGVLGLVLAILSLGFLGASRDVLNKKPEQDPAVNFFTIIMVGPAAYALSRCCGVISAVLLVLAAIFGIIGVCQY